MKQRSIRRFITFLLCSSMLIIGCQEDNALEEAATSNQNFTSRQSIVTIDDIPIIKQFLSNRTNSQFRMDLPLSQKPGTTREQGDLIIGDIDTDYIIQIINGPDAANYSFKVTKEGGGDTFSFINLVVEEVGDYISYYFIEYEFDEGYIENKQDASLLDFTGKIHTYNPDGIYVGTIEVDNGSPINFEYRHPCFGDPGGGGSNGPGPLVSFPPGPNCTWELTVAITPCTCEGHTNPVECTCTPQASVIWEWAWVCDGGMKAATRHPCTQVGDPNDPVEDICFQPNTDPCPFGCDPSGDGSCAEDPNTNTGVNIDIGIIDTLNQLLSEPLIMSQTQWIFDPDNPHNMELAQNVVTYLLDNPDLNINFDQALDVVITPDKLNALLENSNFMQSLTTLQQNEDNNIGYETGYEVSKENNLYSFNYVLGGIQFLPLRRGENIVGAMHAHTNFGNPMFSGDDIAQLFLLNQQNDNPDTNQSDIFMLLVSEWGTFVLTIENSLVLGFIVNTQQVNGLNRRLNEFYDNTTQQESASKYINGLIKVFNELEEEFSFPSSAINLYQLNFDETEFILKY